MGNCEILVEGRNFNILFEKLKKAKIDLINIKNINEKTIILVVKAKDCKKVFAILNNVWYNKLIKYTGTRALVEFCKNRIGFLIGLVFFFIIACYFSGVIFSVEINGVNGNEKVEILNFLENENFKKFTIVNESQFNEVKKKIVSINEDINYVTIKKSSNRLIIDVFKENEHSSIKKFENKITSPISGTVRKIVAYKGTSVVSVGQKVSEGDLLIDGTIFLEGKSEIGFAFGYVEIENVVLFEQKVKNFSEESKAEAIEKAKFLIEEKYEIEKVEVKENATLSSYEVYITFLLKIGE